MALYEGDIPDEINELVSEDFDPRLMIGAVFANVPDEGEIHVLVVVPQHYYHDSHNIICPFTGYVHVRPIPANVLLENSINPRELYPKSGYGSRRHYFRAMEPLKFFETKNRDDVNKEFDIEGCNFTPRNTTNDDNEYFMKLKKPLMKVKYGGYKAHIECYIDCNKLKLFLVAIYHDDNGDDSDELEAKSYLQKNSWSVIEGIEPGNEDFCRSILAESEEDKEDVEGKETTVEKVLYCRLFSSKKSFANVMQ